MNIEKYFKDYFKELEELEKTMNKKYKNISKKIEDPELKKKFEKIASEEKEHQKFLIKVREILEEETTSEKQKEDNYMLEKIILLSLILAAFSILLNLAI